MNIYFENPDAGFNLTQFPDRYKGEWQDNADWLSLSFHALSNNCYGGRIYRDGTYETVKRDYQQVTEQILRFAGEASLSRSYTTLHIAECPREVCQALCDLGIHGLTGRFGVPDGDPFPTRYYLDANTNAYIKDRNMFYDREVDLYFVNCSRALNNIPLAEVVQHFENLLNGDNKRLPFDIIDFVPHEQHFWRGYSHYKPDNMERCIKAVQLAVEHHLKPVRFDNGICGNPVL